MSISEVSVPGLSLQGQYWGLCLSGLSQGGPGRRVHSRPPTWLSPPPPRVAQGGPGSPGARRPVAQSPRGLAAETKATPGT